MFMSSRQKSTKDMGRIVHAMQGYATLKRQSGNTLIFEFYEDCVLDPAKRRWVTYSGKVHDHRAVENAKAELRKIVVDLDKMITGEFVRPLFAQKPSPPPAIVERSEPYMLPIAPPMVPKNDGFDWKAVVIRPLIELNTSGSRNASQSVLRTMFNEYLRASRVVLARLEDNRAKRTALDVQIEVDSEVYARQFSFLDNMIKLDDSFAKLPNMQVETGIFQVKSVPDAPKADEPKANGYHPPSTAQSPKISGKTGGKASSLMVAITDMMRKHPTTRFDASRLQLELAQVGLPDLDAKKIGACLDNSVHNKSKTLVVERVAPGTYQWKGPTEVQAT
jgi:hypothetical protein